MILTSTFIPTQRVKDLLCELFTEYQHAGSTPGRTTVILIAIRSELGREEYKRFESDLAGLLKSMPASSAIRKIIHAAIARTPGNYASLAITRIQPGFNLPRSISNRFD